MADVALVLSHRVGLSTALPYAEMLEHIGVGTRLYCLGDFADIARKLGPSSMEIVGHDDLEFSAKSSRWANTVLFGLSSMPPGMNPDQQQSFGNRSLLGRNVRQAALKISQRVPPSTLNSCTAGIMRWGRAIIPEDQVWIISFLTDPIVLAGGGHSRVVTLLDSWDHPTRRTAGYRTDVVIGWNIDTALDWQRFQGAETAVSGAPMKLRYAAEAPANQPCLNKRFMFAVGTSSHTPAWEQAELRLADLVAQAAGDTGWEMILKTKPTGGQDAWVEFAARYEHVISTETPSASTPMDYFLDPAYNDARLSELANVRFVLNTVTTFGLDAACAGKPVLQLAGLQGDGLRGLASAQQNVHIRKYLTSRDSDLMLINEADVRRQLGEWLEGPDDRAERYSHHLRQWLVPAQGFDFAVEAATRAAIA